MEHKNRLRTIWSGMKQRCYNKGNSAYKYYGGRGIKLSDPWKKDFECFCNDMYSDYIKHLEEYGRKNTSIDRVNNDGNYEKSNCRWATSKMQANNRRNTVIKQGDMICFKCDKINGIHTAQKGVCIKCKQKSILHQYRTL